VLAGCSSARYEGGQAGDCTDGADNDADGAYDCLDDGCASAPACLEPDPVREGNFEFGEIVLCAEPVSGIARLVEVSLERGIDLEVFDPVSGGDPIGGATTGRGGSLLAVDIDADGDIDLLQGPKTLYLNDGTGHFARVAGPLSSDMDGSSTYLGAHDLNGDGLPDLIGDWESSDGFVRQWWMNSGGGTFTDGQVLELPAGATEAINASLALGDLDGDGDLDIAYLTGAYHVGEADGPLVFPATPVYQNQGGTYQHWFDLVMDWGGHPSAQVALFTDRDADGDQDLLVPNDWPMQGGPSAFWRNDGLDAAGLPILVDDAGPSGAALDMAAMGIDSTDLNGDGLLDYCITDVGRPLCLVSGPDGLYFEGGAALGLYPGSPAERGGDDDGHGDDDDDHGDDDVAGPGPSLSTVGWSLDFTDLDNDGYVECIQASAPDSTAVEHGVEEFVDLMWQGLPDGTFVDVSAQVGFDDLTDHLGLVSADFEGDGFLDIVTAGRGSVPRLYANPCGSNNWIDVILDGPPGNPEGFGARVELTWSGGVQVREMMSLRATSQGPPRVHFGLGSDAQVGRLRVIWPGGEISTWDAFEGRRQVRVGHSLAPNKATR
jgi:hypothetical protein